MVAVGQRSLDQRSCLGEGRTRGQLIKVVMWFYLCPFIHVQWNTHGIRVKSHGRSEGNCKGQMVDDGVPDSETADQTRRTTTVSKSADHNTQCRLGDSRSTEYSPNSDTMVFEDCRRTQNSEPEETPSHPVTGPAPLGIVFVRGRRTAHLLSCLLTTDFITRSIYISDLNGYSTSGGRHPRAGTIHSNYFFVQ